MRLRGVAWCVGSVACARALATEWAAGIRATFAARDARPIDPSVVSCTITPDEPCSIADFPVDETAIVYPGGRTRCIYSDSSSYSFQVICGRMRCVYSDSSS